MSPQLTTRRRHLLRIPLLRRTRKCWLYISNRSYVIHLLLATVATLTLGLATTIHAQETTYDASFSSNVKEAIPINVLVGQSRVINFDRPIGRFSISNPEIAEAVMVRPDQVLVNGKAFGQVNFIAWEKS